MSKKKLVPSPTTIEYIAVSDISVDPTYQRELDENRARAIGEALDLSRIGVLTVSRRADGSVVAVDGMHRHAGLVVAGMSNQLIRCEVHRGLDRQAEAVLFRKLNKGRKPIGALDDYRAGLEAKDPVSVEIHEIVTRLKLRIGTNHRNTIHAIRAVKSVHLRQKNLERTLRILSSWDDRPCVFVGELLKSVSIFLAHYDARADSPGVDDAHLIRQLRSNEPEAVVNAIKRRTDKFIRLPEAGCSILRDLYNKRLGAKRKLPPYIRGGQAGVRNAVA